jgi:hypothetical protein
MAALLKNISVSRNPSKQIEKHLDKGRDAAFKQVFRVQKVILLHGGA